ncbi:right-handed parallel beta-helix repeat-containing protein [Enterococcus sp. LJL98]
MPITYYVSASLGNDQNTGMTPEVPWKTLEKINQQVFQPGDQILLKTDDTWMGVIKPQGSGTKEAPIRLASYGTGARPVIHGGGTKYGVYSSTILLENQSHWRIEQLELTNHGTDERVGQPFLAPYVRAGIYLIANRQGTRIENIKVRQCYIHDVVSHTGGEVPGASAKISGGIIVLAEYRDIHGQKQIPDTANTAGFKQIEISQNIIYRVMHEGIRTKVEGGAWPHYPRNGEDVTIKNNYIEKTLGDGIVMSEIATTGLVEGNIVKDCAHWALNEIYYAAVWAHCSDNLLFQYNEVFDTLYGQKDGEAFDADNECHGTIFQYNYSHHNRGGALLVMDSQTETVYRYNISANDGWGDGEEIINDHATKTQTLDASVPKIYHNTFYIDQNANQPLYGSLTGQGFAYFKNNWLLVQTKDQQLRLGKTALAWDSHFQGNLFPTKTFFQEQAWTRFSDQNQAQFVSLPDLKETLAAHRTYSLESQGLQQIEADLAQPIARLRQRVQMFQPPVDFPVGKSLAELEGAQDFLGFECLCPPVVGALSSIGKKKRQK